ncbi:ATP-dependent RNA helicase HrpA [Paraglaciecola aquimarina]|uniref:ATP-dependent RNA helicase HrpA n=1 Tax=Paraglaciecola algarum TaxID=3050085 RepID=A0ABS9D7F2_9ALTE|nr:ATP-dependent RNA helicase HrpA [Paraglaciecola sp. G1-23]MCF2948897.1 ATP-dependent RNA helicase HrpA [Paraglaciecola sp. G1-23]
MNANTPSMNIKQLSEQVSSCMSKDIFRFKSRIRRFPSIEPDKQAEYLQKLGVDVEKSSSLAETRLLQCPDIEYPDLPVSEKKDEIAQAIKSNQVVIIAGETGSGKTTQIPKICLELGRGIKGLIGHTQPRRLAARTVSNRIAEELKSPIGQNVGFKIRFSDQVSDNTYIKLMTDGILLAEIQQDKFLNQYDTIIIDEAHERSLNIDFILGYLKQLLPRRPDLKLIITSATIDPLKFSKHFNDAPVIEVSGRTYPVEMRYKEIDSGEYDQIQAITEAVDELLTEPRGDILVFLSGEREIRDTADALNKQQYRNTEVLPLYARLSNSEQNKVFASHTGRRIVLATNVAETSLTVPGIKYVIDPGTARISRYSVRSKVQRLPIEAISQASANQRAGRCGRVSNGICIRLYSEEDYLARDVFTDPEILRTNLASVILQMMSLGLGKIDQFPFVQPPDSRAINDGFKLLEELGAIDLANDSKHGRQKLSKLGRQLARLPIDPRYARMVIEAAKQNSLNEVLIIAAGLSIQDPRERPQDKKQQADQAQEDFFNKESDFLGFFQLWREFKQQQQALSSNQLRTWCKKHFINFMRMREWQDIVSQLKKSIAELGFGISSQEADYQAIHQAIAAGLLSHIGNKDKDREYLGARNSRFMIFPGSGLAKAQPKWTMVAELVETAHLFGRVAAKIEPEWIESLASHLTKSEFSEPHWSKKQGVVQAFEKVSLYGLVLVSQRRKNYSLIDPVVSREIFIREALVNMETRLNFAFLKHNHQIIEDIENLESKSRRRDLLVDEETLVDFYAQKIPEHVCSEASFKKWWKKQSQDNPKILDFDPNALLKKTTNHIDGFSFPETFKQGNLTLGLTYHFDPKDEDDGVSLMVPLALLNQVTTQGLDWLIPGLRHELIVALIKALPKSLRRNFVPAPNYADACLADIQSQDKKGNALEFLPSLSLKLKRMTGKEVEISEWPMDKLPKHLIFNIKVLDNKGQVIAQGRDLNLLQQKLQGKVKQNLQKVATPELEQTGLSDWSIESLPKEFINKAGGYEVKAYPALVNEGKTVGVKLFDQAHIAQQAHKLGLRRLIILAIPSPIKYLQDKLPNKAKLGLYFNPFGQIKALIDDCINAAVDQLVQQYCEQHDADIRDKTHFKACSDFVRQEINDTVLEVAKKVEVGLTIAHEIKKKMKGNVPLNLIYAHGHIKAQLDSLVYKDFAADIGVTKLNDWQRYIKALAKRLEKVAIDPTKDKLHQLNVEKAEHAYQAKCNQIPANMPKPEGLKEVRWLLQELQVSFFAQQLGTSAPISVKRILNHLDQI